MEQFEAETYTTQNGHEIEHPRQMLSFEELHSMLGEYNLSGEGPKQRLDKLRVLPKEQLAIFMTDLDRRMQGSDESLVSEDAMRLGEQWTIPVADRYDVFTDCIDEIQHSRANLNPARAGDALALLTVLLHPFYDGNGRTARTLGFIFHDDFDKTDASESFGQLTEPRDVVRAEKRYVINGYIPKLPKGYSQTDPTVVKRYIQELINPSSASYTGPFGAAELTTL